MIYKQGDIDQIPQIIDVVTKMVVGTKIAPPSQKKLERIIQHFYTEGVWDGDKLVAFMAGQLSETFLNDEINAYEKGLFVLPEYRGGSTAFRLVKNFEAWARSKGAAYVWMGQSVGQNKEKTLHFFERLGYECQGFTTCKKL